MNTSAHRGLFFDEADLPRIRANTTDPRFAAFWQTQLQADIAADTNFLSNELRLTNHTVHLLRAQRILERASFIYLVNREPGQLALAKLALRRMLDYPEWDSFIEGGRQVIGLQRATEGTVALLQAMECLGDAVTRGRARRGRAGGAHQGCAGLLHAGLRDEISRPRAGLELESAQRSG
jgi:hypothetical protein